MEQNQQPRPRRTYITARMKLLQAQLADYPAVAISAPMGCGKTVAANYLIKTLNRRVLRFNCNTNSPTKFWQDICQCLVPGMAADTPLPLIAKAITRQGPVVLFIDDYQNAQNDRLTQRLLDLTLADPENIKLFLCSRQWLWAPDSEPVCKGQVLPVQDIDLRLSPKEIMPFCRSCQVQVTSIQAKKLYIASEGWMMAVFLMLSDYVKSGRLRVHPALPRLLLHQVEQLRPALKEFLLRIAPASASFTLKEAEFLWQRPEAEALLHELLESGFYLTWDIHEDIYRFYPMMVTALRSWLDKHPVRPQVYQRLAQWEQAQGNTLQAMDACFQAMEHDALLDMLDVLPREQAAGLTLEQGRDWFTGCQEEVLLVHPRSLLQFVWLFTLHGQVNLTEQARALYARARNILAPGTSASNSLDYSATVLEGCINSRPEELMVQLRRAQPLAGISGLDPVALPLGAGMFSCPTPLALWCHDGDLTQTADMIASAEAEISSATLLPLAGVGDTLYAEAMYYAGDLDEARIYAQRARRLADSGTNDDLLLPTRALTGRILFANGRMERLTQLIADTRQRLIQRFGHHSSQMAGLDILEAMFWATSQQPGRPAAWIREGELESRGLPSLTLPIARLCYAMVLYRDGKYTQIISLEPALLYKELTPLVRLYGLLVLSAASEQLRRSEKAESYLTQAIAIAQSNDIVMPFVELYGMIQQPLQRLESDWAPLSDQIPRLGCQFGSTIELPAKLSVHNAAGLTAREVEIATMASQGMYNREISQKLSVSENTIKSALKNIFTKLEIHSRRELPDALKKVL